MYTRSSCRIARITLRRALPVLRPVVVNTAWPGGFATDARSGGDGSGRVVRRRERSAPRTEIISIGRERFLDALADL